MMFNYTICPFIILHTKFIPPAENVNEIIPCFGNNVFLAREYFISLFHQSVQHIVKYISPGNHSCNVFYFSRLKTISLNLTLIQKFPEHHNVIKVI